MHGTIDNVPHVSKSAKKKGLKAEMLVFNELAGHNLARKKLKDSTHLSMIPTQMFVSPKNPSELWIEGKGNSDVYLWVKGIRTALSNKKVVPVAVVEKSVRLILDELRAFITALNCPHNKQSVYHCDLHPANIRLGLLEGDFYNVQKTYVIDFDLVRGGACDEFRSSSSMFGYSTVTKGWIRAKMFSGSSENRGLTDWAFFYTTCSLLYGMLAEVSEVASYVDHIQDHDGCKGV